MERLSKGSYVSAFDLARVHIAQGDDDTAMCELERAHEERSVGLTWIKSDPALDPLRCLTRFQDLQRRVGSHAVDIAQANQT